MKQPELLIRGCNCAKRGGRKGSGTQKVVPMPCGFMRNRRVVQWLWHVNCVEHGDMGQLPFPSMFPAIVHSVHCSMCNKSTNYNEHKLSVCSEKCHKSISVPGEAMDQKSWAFHGKGVISQDCTSGILVISYPLFCRGVGQ